MNRWIIRATGTLMVLLSARSTYWVIANLNGEALWIAVPFAAATILLLIDLVLAVINNWSIETPKTRFIPQGAEPKVATIIPTWGETPSMVMKTVESVFAQDYPAEKLFVIVSDDAHNLALRFAIAEWRRRYRDLAAQIEYFEPPKKGSSERRGESKSGNLNAALALLESAPDIAFIETRDADDLVGDETFLRQSIAQLLHDPKLGFVQTVKQAQVAPGDPFNNLEPFFYQVILPARCAANSVFPCGSGVVFRRQALDNIGGFPTWNIVEDLQAGVEILSKGWRSTYLPIVGAVSQSAPEDIRNVYKQRGTWALDTMRLFFWRNFWFQKGLDLRQKLAFSDMGIAYLLSFVALTFMAIPIVSLVWDVRPVVTADLEYLLNVWPQAAATELFFLVLWGRRFTFEQIWRSREMWIGLAPLYAKATILALLYGPNRKPAYRVTRKEEVAGWYWRETLLQSVFWVTLVVVAAAYLAKHSLSTFMSQADLGSLFWAAFFILGLKGIVQKSWYHFQWREHPLVRFLFTPRYALSSIITVIVISVGLSALFTFNSSVLAFESTTIAALPSPLPTAQPLTVASLLQDRPVLRVPEFGEPAKYAPPILESVQREARNPINPVKPINAPLALNAAGKVGLGLYTNVTDDNFQLARNFETLVNHKMMYIMWFQAWGDTDRDFQTARVKLAGQNGYIPVITWEPWKRDFANPSRLQPEFSFASINAGRYDAYIRNWARAAASTKVPIIVRFAHEQSTEPGTHPWYPWQGDPEGYKTAFRRIVAIFKSEGATNAKFLWSAMWIYDPKTALYYPGDDIVDYVGTTVVNHSIAITADWAKWRTFAELFGAQYDVAVDTWQKPFIITEFGSAEQGGDKAAWLADTLGNLDKYPFISGVILLEVTRDREAPNINWSVTSSPATLNAFKTKITSNYFK